MPFCSKTNASVPQFRRLIPLTVFHCFTKFPEVCLGSFCRLSVKTNKDHISSHQCTNMHGSCMILHHLKPGWLLLMLINYVQVGSSISQFLCCFVGLPIFVGELSMMIVWLPAYLPVESLCHIAYHYSWWLLQTQTFFSSFSSCLCICLIFSSPAVPLTVEV